MYSSGRSSGEQVGYVSWFKRVFSERSPSTITANVVGLSGAIATIFCLLVLPGSDYWNIRLPLYLLISVLILLRPRVALYLMPIAVPWGSLDTANMGGLHLADILTMLLAGSWLMSFALRQQVIRQGGLLERDAEGVPRYLIFAIVVFLLAIFTSMVATTSLSLSLKELVKWLEVLIIVLIGAQYLRTRRQIWLLVVIVCLAAISQACFGYIQSFFNLGPSSFVRDTALRVYGTFDQPNPYAGYINMALTIALALFVLGKGLKVRLLAGVTTILLAGAEYLSQSKGGWLALAGALVFILTLGLPRIRGLMLALACGFLSVVGAFLAGVIPQSVLMPVWERAGFLRISFTAPTNDSYANSERLAHWLAGIRMFQDHPFLGVGIGNYPVVYAQYAPGIFVLPLGHAHNYYINMAAEAGIIGLLTLLFFLGASFVAGGRAYGRLHRRWLGGGDGGGHAEAVSTVVPTEAKLGAELARLRRAKMEGVLANDRALAVGILAALVSVCVHNLVDDLYVHSMTNLFALLLIMLIRLDRVNPLAE